MFLDYVAKFILGLVILGMVGLIIAVFIAAPIFLAFFVISGLVIWACMRLNYID